MKKNNVIIFSEHFIKRRIVKEGKIYCNEIQKRQMFQGEYGPLGPDLDKGSRRRYPIHKESEPQVN